MSGASDEFQHLIKHAVQQQTNDYRPFVYGHVSSWDPVLHRVRCIVPTLRDESGTPVLTPWMPIDEAAVGNGWGQQHGIVGGATFEKPTAGEQVKISIVERVQGVAVVAARTYNQVMAAPFPKMMPGEQGYKHASGTMMYFHDDGSVEITQGKGKGQSVTDPPQQGTTSSFLIDKDGNVSLTTANAKTGNINISAASASTGNISVSDAHKNSIAMSKDGITLIDNNGNKIEMTSSGIKLTSVKVSVTDGGALSKVETEAGPSDVLWADA